MRAAPAVDHGGRRVRRPSSPCPSRCQPVARICGAMTVSYAPAAWSDSAARSSWKCMRSGRVLRHLVDDLRAAGSRGGRCRRRARRGWTPPGRSSAMIPHIAERPKRRGEARGGSPRPRSGSPRPTDTTSSSRAARRSAAAPTSRRARSRATRPSRRTRASAATGPTGPASSRSSSSKSPTTVPNGCIISRLPTRPRRVRQALVGPPDRSSSRGVPMPLAARMTTPAPSAVLGALVVEVDDAGREAVARRR